MSGSGCRVPGPGFGALVAVFASLAAGAEPPPAAVAPAGAERAAERVFQDVARRLAPSVVSIDVVGVEHGVDPAKAFQFRRAEGPTTGVVVSADGLVATSNFHFKTQDPVSIRVRLHDGRELPARMLGKDQSRGIAVLKVEARGLPVPPDCPKAEIRVGQWGIALGRALGDEPSVHVGIVSAVQRVAGRAIQTDAALSPANYGGPLADAEGRLLGICVPLSEQGEEVGAAMYDSGIGFAIPIEDIRRFLPRLARGEVLRPAFLGILWDTAKSVGGVEVTGVLPRTAAEEAGIEKGDVILSVAGVPTPQFFLLQFEIGKRVAGDRVDLKIRRAGKEMDVPGMVLRAAPEGDDLTALLREYREGETRRVAGHPRNRILRLLEQHLGKPPPPPPRRLPRMPWG